MDHTSPEGIRARYRSAFLKGLAAILPTVLTLYILLWAFSFVDQNIATPINGAIKAQLKAGPGREVAVRLLHVDPTLLEGSEAEFSQAVDDAFPSWVGFLAGVVLCFVVGFFIASFIGQRLWGAVEGWLGKLPVVRAIYPSAKQITEFFIKDGSKEPQFSRVGFVPYPLQGQWSLGFVMADGFRELDRRTKTRNLSVFVPMAPTPVTGFVVMVPESQFVPVDISVDEAFKFYVTAGLVIPDRHRALSARPTAAVQEAQTPPTSPPPSRPSGLPPLGEANRCERPAKPGAR